MSCTYGSFSRDLTALNSGVAIAVATGGNLTAGQNLWLSVQIRCRGGLTLHTTPTQVTTDATNNAISVTITSAALATGDYPFELIISGSSTNDVTQMARLASWRFRDAKSISYVGHGTIVYPGEGPLRVLPKTVLLTEDAHIALSATVADAAALPVGNDLIHGMLRQLLNTNDYVVYDSEASSGDHAAAVGFWKVFHPGFAPAANGSFSTYYGSSPENEGGSDRVVTELHPSQVIIPPAYAFDGSPQDPPIILFFNNGFASGSGSSLAQGGSLSLQFLLNGSDVSAAFAGRATLQLLGYCDRQTGVLDATNAGAEVTWIPGASAVTLPVDLPVGQAAVYAFRLQARKDEITNDRDLASQKLEDGSQLAVRLFYEGSLGRPSTIWYFLGDVIYSVGDQMKLVPVVNGLRRLSGAATVQRFDTTLVGTYLVDDVLDDTADQQACISGALNGAIIMRPSGEALGDTEALRATISTASGTMAPSDWSGPVSLTAGTQTLRFTVESPAAIRADYPDALIASNAQGENNVSFYRVFIEVPGGSIYELDAPVAVSPTGTTLIEVSTLDDASVQALPTQADAAFGLFGYGEISSSAISGGSLVTGSYRVCVANYWEPGNREITKISHGSIEVLTASLADLLNQSLPYARLTAGFVQPAVAATVETTVDNNRILGVGGSVVINDTGNALQGYYTITAKSGSTSVTLLREPITGDVATGGTVANISLVIPTGRPGEGAGLQDVMDLAEQVTTPATPDAGIVKIYAKTDGRVYKLQSNGLETQVGGFDASKIMTIDDQVVVVDGNVIYMDG